MSSFRVQTLHNILVEGLAMLQLSESNPYQRFTSDQLIWHKNYWKYLPRAYGPKRGFLSTDKQIINVLRFTLFALIETRLHQVESKDFKNSLDGKITSFVQEFKKLLDHQNLISLALKHIRIILLLFKSSLESSLECLD